MYGVDLPTQLFPSVLAVVPVGQLNKHFPPDKKDPARQAEQVNWLLVDAEVKLSIAPAVHFAGRAVEKSF